MHVNACVTVKLLAGFLQYNGGKLDEFEGYNFLFIVSLVSIEIRRSALVRELLRNNYNIIIIILTLFQEDNIFGTNASLTYGPQIQRHTCV